MTKGDCLYIGPSAMIKAIRQILPVLTPEELKLYRVNARKKGAVRKYGAERGGAARRRSVDQDGNSFSRTKRVEQPGDEFGGSPPDQGVRR